MDECFEGCSLDEADLAVLERWLLPGPLAQGVPGLGIAWQLCRGQRRPLRLLLRGYRGPKW